ncbi:low molecular weight protein-tyrosine-phosphatase [Gracilibacillus saliphilus]|uniref:low molecular weight protein-tyrosine-phosphatase n=1 Tax=Gracilibacillus saliphilus TaxID=543890 RepID=UPI0013D041EC|nr:low molecular weight protein-tyrosine-phosphatase [Gracilibacillus saliphilus]
MIKVLFICLGNICRSPMAEAVFRHIVKEKGVEDQFVIDSAGLGDWHIGNPPHQGTRAKLDELNISYHGQKARQIQANDIEDFDYVIAMDQQNMDDLSQFSYQASGVTVKKLMDFVDQPKEQNVPDPYFTKNFDYTYELVKEGCEQLFTCISNKHNLDIK